MDIESSATTASAPCITAMAAGIDSVHADKAPLALRAAPPLLSGNYQQSLANAPVREFAF
jgi:hypothetical protein